MCVLVAMVVGLPSRHAKRPTWWQVKPLKGVGPQTWQPCRTARIRDELATLCPGIKGAGGELAGQCSPEQHPALLSPPAPPSSFTAFSTSDIKMPKILGIPMSARAASALPAQAPDLRDARALYWRKFFEGVEDDCKEVSAHLRVTLKIEILAAIQRYTRASKEGVTRPSRSLAHHTLEVVTGDSPATAVPVNQPATPHGFGPLPAHSGSQSLQLTAQQLAVLQAQLVGSTMTSTPKDLSNVLINTEFLNNFHS
ncbi:uncharacterized protein [Macrobrachium rosenbergii]|uniref:uncharacterized protein n=1 Tax=Macrobrachium rosenbergii TaxID=79674 RepID=UPI0034D75AF3